MVCEHVQNSNSVWSLIKQEDIKVLKKFKTDHQALISSNYVISRKFRPVTVVIHYHKFDP